MAIIINTNVASLQAQKNLATSQLALDTSFRRLSSGLRINTASDDAAGMAVSENLTAQIGSYTVSQRNANNGISMVNTAEGGLAEVSNMIIRMRELAVQSSNGDLQASDRSNLDIEYQGLAAEIDRVAKTTNFNGTALLDGSTSQVTFQVGINTSANDKINVALTASDSATLFGAVGDLTNVANAQTAITNSDAALKAVSAERAELGGSANRLAVAVSNTSTMITNLSAANSVIADVDIAEETSAMARTQVKLQAGAAVLAQANQSPQLALSLLRS